MCSESSLGLRSPQAHLTGVDAPHAITVGAELGNPPDLAKAWPHSPVGGST